MQLSIRCQQKIVYNLMDHPVVTDGRTLVKVCLEQKEARPQPLSGSIRFVETSAVCFSAPLTSRTETLNLNHRGTTVQLCM